MIAYKGFTADLTCLGFQYAVGETYTHDGPVRVCERGFHACPNPLDVLTYYQSPTSRYALVECSGRIDADGEGKIACETITIVRELTIAELIRASDAPATTTGYYAPAATTGDYAHATTTGRYAHAATTGYYAPAATTGDYAHAVTTGRYAHAATTGYYAPAATTGRYAHAVTTGRYAHAATTGYYAHAVTTGDCAHAATTGDCAHAATSGYYAHAVTTGDCAHAATSGDSAVSVAVGRMSAAKAASGGFLVLAQHDGSQVVAIRTAQVGKDGIKPDTWYKLGPTGEFVEYE